MNEQQQITYMQARIIRLASEEWNASLAEIVSLFAEFNVLSVIRDCFDMFHLEGDFVVLEEIREYLIHRGAKFNAELN